MARSMSPIPLARGLDALNPAITWSLSGWSYWVFRGNVRAEIGYH